MMSFRTRSVGLCYGAGEKTYTPGILATYLAYKFSPHPNAQSHPSVRSE